VTLANRIHMTDTAIPTFARHCRCDRIEPVADNDGTCPFCGHQLEGKPMPSKVVHKAEPAPRGESGRRMPRHAGR
jgi:rRNA maturation endonuclease Nob1